MKKILIFSIILFVIIFFCNTIVNATDISMDLGSNSEQVDSQQDQGNNQNVAENQADSTVYGTQNDETESLADTSVDVPVTVGTSAALSSSDLALSNILNIILIVLGILLVLLAIAILILYAIILVLRQF